MKSLLAAIVSVACLATLAMLTPDEADGGIFGRWRAASSCANGSCATAMPVAIRQPQTHAPIVEVEFVNDTIDARQEAYLKWMVQREGESHDEWIDRLWGPIPVPGVVDNDPMGLAHEEPLTEYEVTHNGPVARALTAPARVVAAPVRFVANRQPLRRAGGALRRVGGFLFRGGCR